MNQAIKERTPGSNSPQNWSQINLKYFGDHFQRFAPPFWTRLDSRHYMSTL